MLPPGYAELIEECSVHHYHLTGQSLDRQRLGMYFDVIPGVA